MKNKRKGFVISNFKTRDRVERFIYSLCKLTHFTTVFYLVYSVIARKLTNRFY